MGFPVARSSSSAILSSPLRCCLSLSQLPSKNCSIKMMMSTDRVSLVQPLTGLWKSPTTFSRLPLSDLSPDSQDLFSPLPQQQQQQLLPQQPPLPQLPQPAEFLKN